MKKTRKGITLVEVIVSIAVFTIISLALFSSILAMRKVVLRQEEYARLEMVVHDINAYWDAYGKDWDKEMFKKSETSSYCYLSSDFNLLSNSTGSGYRIEYKYDGDDKLIITLIKSQNGDHVYAENINCGVSKNETP